MQRREKTSFCGDAEGMMQGRGLGREQGCYPDGCRQRSDRSAALRAVPKPKDTARGCTCADIP